MFIVFQYNGSFLKPIETNQTLEDLKKYGKVEREIVDHYDKDKSKVVGYIFKNNIYAIGDK